MGPPLRPGSHPHPVEGEGVWEPRGGRTRGSAPTTGGHPHPALSRRGRGGMGAARRADTWVCPYDWGVTLTPLRGRLRPLPSRERGYGSRAAGGHVGLPLRLGSHPHPYRVRGSPLPSRERGYGSRAAGGHVGPPLRLGSHPHPRIEYGAGSALSRRGRGGMGAARRADTWVRPYDWGVTLTPALSRRGRGGMGAAAAGGHVGPPLRSGSHPHPSPLPSRARQGRGGG